MLTVSVPLTQGKVAVVDEADYPLIAEYKWRAVRHHSGRNFYAATWSQRGAGRKELLMHRVILGAPDGSYVDHRNQDGLDNRRNNLRLATRDQNRYNSRPWKRPTRSGFKGVNWSKHHSKWWASITCQHKRHYLGHFDDAADAARAYDAKARELFGEFAWLNFPD